MDPKQTEKITLVDQVTINGSFEQLDRLTNLLNEAKEAYTKVFSEFDIDLFTSLFESKNPEIDLVSKYLFDNKIELPGIKLETALAQDLIERPNTKPLIDLIKVIKDNLKGLRMVSYEDFGLMYDEERMFFPRSTEGNTLMFDKIRLAHTSSPETVEEFHFLEELKQFSELFVKFKKEYHLLPENDIPIGLFSFNGKVVKLNPRVLKKFRTRRKG